MVRRTAYLLHEAIVSPIVAACTYVGTHYQWAFLPQPHA